MKSEIRFFFVVFDVSGTYAESLLNLAIFEHSQCRSLKNQLPVKVNSPSLYTRVTLVAPIFFTVTPQIS